MFNHASLPHLKGLGEDEMTLDDDYRPCSIMRPAIILWVTFRSVMLWNSVAKQAVQLAMRGAEDESLSCVLAGGQTSIFSHKLG